MGAPAFRPEQFELTFLCEWHPHENSGIELSADVASNLANGVFARHRAHRELDEHWPEDTRVFVALGSTASYGVDRQLGGGTFVDSPHAQFGIGTTPEQPLEVSTVYKSYMKAVQHALDLYEIERYYARDTTLAAARYLGKTVSHNIFRQRYNRRLEHKVSEMLLTIPRPLEPLLERAT
jgi:hypothetical protein